MEVERSHIYIFHTRVQLEWTSSPDARRLWSMLWHDYIAVFGERIDYVIAIFLDTAKHSSLLSV